MLLISFTCRIVGTGVFLFERGGVLFPGDGHEASVTQGR